MTQEEKAKAYDEALEKARQLCAYPTTKPFISDLQDLFPELKESDGDNICKNLIAFLKQCKAVYGDGFKQFDLNIDDAIAWIEKQGEHANFRNKIQIGDKVTRNEDGVLVNLSQLKRVAKKDEKRGEQKQELSEEDEKMLNLIIARLHSHPNVELEEYSKEYDWLNYSLKSVRPQNHWKPSDEQMKALQVFLAHGCAAPDKEASIAEEVVDGLYNDLKKLRGE